MEEIINDNTSVYNTSSIDNTSADNTSVSESVEKTGPSDEELNFKALREAKKKIELERDEFATRIKNLEAAALTAKEVDGGDDDLYEDDVSKLRKEVNALNQERIRERNQSETQLIENKLKTEFPDLEKVVNADNIEILKARDPNFAKIISKQPSNPSELYHRAVAAYTLIKKNGIFVEDNHEKDRSRVKENMSKPRPASSAVTSSASEGLADFSEFAGLNTEDRRMAIFKLARKRADS